MGLELEKEQEQKDGHAIEFWEKHMNKDKEI